MAVSVFGSHRERCQEYFRQLTLVLGGLPGLSEWFRA